MQPKQHSWWASRLLGSLFAMATICMVACSQSNPAADAPGSAAPVRAAGAAKPESSTNRNVFRSPLAGTWYDNDKASLTTELERYIQKASDQKQLDDVCALISPHAGFAYSGQTAAYGYQQLKGHTYRRVVVIGPSHRVPLQNVASVPDATHYATPLGEIALDQEMLAQLKKHAVFQTVPRVHDGEHSVQIQLPLLQSVTSGFRLVPIVVGQLDRQTTRTIANILRSLIDDQTLVIASSDFTHYGENFGYFPFREDIAENLKKLDMGAWALIEKKDTDGFYDYIDRTEATICGRYAIGVLLDMLPKEAKAHLLQYDTSGNITGDYASSVSYLSIAFTGHWPKGKPAPVKSNKSQLSDSDKALLLRLARATLTYAVKHGRVPTVEQLGIEIPDALKTPSGVFVTLNKRGQLRGCIGEMVATRPLYQAVMAQAANAGLNDPRFAPVREEELPDLAFEISVLTPFHAVDSAKDIVLGKHGILLEKDGRSAVFLPQVAGQQGWNLEQTLEHLSRKAGLAPDAWKNGASFRVFEAIVFGES